MLNDDIDRILLKQDEILPSSGFADSVMEAVRREVAAPPPIPFPWKRAFPVLALAAVALALLVVVGIAAIVQLSRGSFLPGIKAVSMPPLLPSPHGILDNALGWTGLSLLLAFISVKLSMWLTAGRA